jgi:hypothetical protein
MLGSALSVSEAYWKDLAADLKLKESTIYPYRIGG